jgi:glutathione peroxidase
MSMNEQIYQISLKTTEGLETTLNPYKGKVLLIVNTASECGFTSQYAEMEELYKQYKHLGLEVLAFPSNDFGKQEPLEGNNIASFCTSRFRTTFPIFDKISVKGKQAHPLYKYLSDKNLNGQIGIPPRWNFHKYLIGKNGKLVDYFLPFTKPNASKIKKAIERCLLEKVTINP